MWTLRRVSNPTMHAGRESGRFDATTLVESRLDDSYRVARLILRNPADAEDAIHDAFLAAWHRRTSLRDAAKLEAWFGRIVTNACRDRLRHRRRHPADRLPAEPMLSTLAPQTRVADRLTMEAAFERLTMVDPEKHPGLEARAEMSTQTPSSAVVHALPVQTRFRIAATVIVVRPRPVGSRSNDEIDWVEGCSLLSDAAPKAFVRTSDRDRSWPVSAAVARLPHAVGTSGGAQEIMALPVPDRAAVTAAMADVAKSGKKAARHLRGEIWEVRAEGADVIYRLLFATEGRYSQVLLGLVFFVKKTQRTPPAQIELAEQRLADWRNRG